MKYRKYIKNKFHFYFIFILTFCILKLIMNKTCPICVHDLNENNQIVTKICCNQSVCKTCMRHYILINNTISCVLCQSNDIDSLIKEEKILTKEELGSIMKTYVLGYNHSIDQLLEK